MSKFQSYLNEKFVNAIKWYNEDIEIFINPSNNEMRDIQTNSPIGYRFFVDFNNKKIYMFSSEIIHLDILEEVRGLIPNFSTRDYWLYTSGEKYVDRIFSGHGQWGDKKVYSDTWQKGCDLWQHIKKYGDLMHPQLIKMLSNDMTWLNKWLDTKQIKKYTQDLIDKIEEQDPIRYY